MKKNRVVRFWAFNPETCKPHRVMLRIDESVSFYRSSKTDEGYYRTYVTIEREDDRLLYTESLDARDCDGRICTEWRGTCPIPIPTVRRQWGEDGRWFNVPDFQQVSRF